MQTFAQEDNSWFIAGGREPPTPKSTPIPPKEGRNPPQPSQREGVQANHKVQSSIVKGQTSKFNGQKLRKSLLVPKFCLTFARDDKK